MIDSDSSRKGTNKKLILAAFIALALLIVCVGGFILYQYLNRPQIESIEPAIGDRGDILTLRGRHFGDIQGESLVTIGGVKPTSSSYLSWSDELIRLRVPETADSGLVYLRSTAGRSNSLLFTNKEQVPVLFDGSQSGSIPSISGLSVTTAPIGAVISVSGLNFGQNQEEGQVLFTAAWDMNDQSAKEGELREYLGVPQRDPNYELWSDKEIRVMVPDGAVSGTMLVRTSRGASNSIYFEVGPSPGVKHYRNKRTYVIRYSVELSGIRASGGNSLYVWVPRPLESSAQRSVKAVQSSERPTVENYRGLMLYHFKDSKDGQSLKALHDFILTSYEVETQPKIDSIKPLKSGSILTTYTKEEAGIPAEDPDLKKTAAEIVGRERNPWRQAKLLYEWIAAKVTIRADLSKSDALSALEDKAGDAYAVSLLYVALCRSLTIPCSPVAGVWMDDSKATHPHWWAEFFVEGLGWVPVDPAFASDDPRSLKARPREKEGLDRRAYYFGNLDNDRIIFSRGFARLNPQAPNSKIKPAGRFYSLQDITEEASASVTSYSSFWSDIEITGVY